MAAQFWSIFSKKTFLYINTTVTYNNCCLSLSIITEMSGYKLTAYITCELYDDSTLDNNTDHRGKCKKYAINAPRKQPITQSLYTNITTPVASSQKNISPTHTQY